MYKEILEILYCPICKKSFDVNFTKSDQDEIIEGTLHCKNHHV